jgi:hypothetical protein
MRYHFRGYNQKLKEWIFGDGLMQYDGGAQILNSKGDWRVNIDTRTIGREIVLEDSAHTAVYQGDILKYSFKHGNEYFNRYYVIKENSSKVWAEELWRDYELDPNTFEVSRFHNTNHKGDTRDITSFYTYEPCKILGTIWTHPELL